MWNCVKSVKILLSDDSCNHCAIFIRAVLISGCPYSNQRIEKERFSTFMWSWRIFVWTHCATPPNSQSLQISFLFWFLINKWLWVLTKIIIEEKLSWQYVPHCCAIIAGITILLWLKYCQSSVWHGGWFWLVKSHSYPQNAQETFY